MSCSRLVVLQVAGEKKPGMQLSIPTVHRMLPIRINWPTSQEKWRNIVSVIQQATEIDLEGDPDRRRDRKKDLWRDTKEKRFGADKRTLDSTNRVHDIAQFAPTRTP